uniref:C-type lectin domain-containing protein n=1 Tax=Pinctada fucata TaxID=50426 RepID=A0A194AJL1_PINFU
MASFFPIFFSLLWLAYACDRKDMVSPFVEECDDDWIPFGDHCYHFSDNRLSWYDAKKYCNRQKSYLARSETPKENIWLQMQLRISNREKSWIGGTDAGHESNWRWESDAETIDYKNFYKPQPDNGGGNEHCLEMNGSGVTSTYMWNDRPCETQSKFVCEKSKKKRGHQPDRLATTLHNSKGK